MTTLMNFDVSGEPANSQQLPPLTEEQQLLQRLAAGEMNAFWTLWQRHQDYLKKCCLRWTNGNSTAAEDLLSQGMLKAWEKAQKYAEKITNFKSWVTTLTRNFWLDLKRRRDVDLVENIEVYAEQEEVGRVSVGDTPGSALEEEEKNRVIRAAIDELPTKMRETFILHYYEALSNQEIAERQGISYANVCKRISQARKILRPKLRGYFIEEEKTSTEVSVTPVAIEPLIEETPLENAGVEAIVDESVLSVAVAEVECVVGEELPEVAVSDQQSESDSVVGSSEGKLEVKSDACRCVKAALCERLLVPILALAQFDEKIGSWGRLPMGKVRGEFVRSSRSPPQPNPRVITRNHEVVCCPDSRKIQKLPQYFVLMFRKG
ncbi:sigma-70 family RNA polymerase sigma factor [Planktothricoides sp. FACHB-1370]|nr:sigma-70 family RNA polymerase sigma factor [Planktothricoides raciborskii FACHB-1370]MBD2584307.1 sigma-70 family RNA polymerase sigma factor [Planktothricoides raciborskii FACHB-1261]